MDTISLIKNSTKFNKVEDLYLNFDLISELIKDDLLKICKSKNLYFSDFEASFKVALVQTKKTLSKTNLKGVQKFFDCPNIESALKWLQSRIINNMLNSNYLKHNFAFKAPIFESLKNYNINKTYDIEKEMELENLVKIDKKELIQGLKKFGNMENLTQILIYKI